MHTGSADSGHYYSYIEANDGGWWEFNDERVSEFDVKNLGDEAFGGKDGEYARIRNAYLLFYERKEQGRRWGIGGPEGEREVSMNCNPQ